MVIKGEETSSGWKDGMGLHCCHFYYGKIHLLSAVVFLVQQALHRNARCTLGLDQDLYQEVETSLVAEGLDVTALKQQGWLELLTEFQIDQFYRAGTASLEEQYRYRAKRMQELGQTGHFIIGQAEVAIKAVGWELFLHHEHEVGPVLQRCSINLFCLYPFVQTCIGPYYRVVRAVHPWLFSAGTLLKNERMVGQTA